MTSKNTSPLCDGLHRRALLQMGAASVFGLTLADFLRADTRSALDPAYRKRSIVNVWLAGGASHLDTFDMKPDAPAEFRGEFESIATRIPGVRICEHLPRIAERMDRMVLIRSLTGMVDSHDGAMCATGWAPGNMKNLGGRPNIGSVVAKLQGPTNGNVPTAVAMISAYNPSEQAYFRSAGFLGPAFDCYTPDSEDGRANLTLRNITQQRVNLLSSLDTLRRDIDELLPPFDIGLSALFDDLESRGMLDDVLVLVWGEFGRTPRINKDAGRDHYAPAASALLFGGGLKVGQVIGSTTRNGDLPADRPIQFQQMFATMYRHLGIDPTHATLVDTNNRPQYLITHTDSIRELTG